MQEMGNDTNCQLVQTLFSHAKLQNKQNGANLTLDNPKGKNAQNTLLTKSSIHPCLQHLLPKHILQPLKQQIRMLLLENKHGP